MRGVQRLRPSSASFGSISSPPRPTVSMNSRGEHRSSSRSAVATGPSAADCAAEHAVTGLGEHAEHHARGGIEQLVARRRSGGGRKRREQLAMLGDDPEDRVHRSIPFLKNSARPRARRAGTADAVEVGEGPGDLEHAVVAAHRDAAALERAVEGRDGATAGWRPPAPRSHGPGISALVRQGVPRSRSAATARASTTCARASARREAGLARRAARSAAEVMRGTRSWMSMRSSSGPEMRPR